MLCLLAFLFVFFLFLLFLVRLVLLGPVVVVVSCGVEGIHFVGYCVLAIRSHGWIEFEALWGQSGARSQRQAGRASQGSPSSFQVCLLGDWSVGFAVQYKRRILGGWNIG